jgi:hypothetical protein
LNRDRCFASEVREGGAPGPEKRTSMSDSHLTTIARLEERLASLKERL